MAETQKRHREEETHFEDETKRHKSYTQILSFLDEEEDEPTQDLSDLFTTFQQELSSSDITDFDPLPYPTQDSHPNSQPAVLVSSTSDCSPSPSSHHATAAASKEDDEKEKVIRHLLEASDDELGLPNRTGMDGGDEEINGGDYPSLSLSDGLWEFEDETANYYTLLQSELFL